MARATTKKELIMMANEQFGKLTNSIEEMAELEQQTDFCFELTASMKEAHWQRDKNIKDVLIHLCEWHRLLIDWENANSSDINKPFLPLPYTWKNYGEMNVEFFKKHQTTSLDVAKQMLANGHSEIIKIIDKYNDEQLFTKAYFKWTGTSSLGQYCISTTVSHYEWAIKKIKMHIKTLKSKKGIM